MQGVRAYPEKYVTVFLKSCIKETVRVETARRAVSTSSRDAESFPIFVIDHFSFVIE